MPSHIATPYHQNIPLLNLRPLPFQRLLYLFNRNLMPAHRTWRFPILLFIPPQPVAKHASSNYSTPLAPVMRSVGNRLRRLFMRKPVPVCLSSLMRKVLQAVPLRTSLGVDMQLIVVRAYFGKLFEVDLFLFERFAGKARELYVMQFPVELDVLASCDLFGSGAHYRRREEIDCWYVLDGGELDVC
jgi:hypothetical protein